MEEVQTASPTALDSQERGDDVTSAEDGGKGRDAAKENEVSVR